MRPSFSYIEPRQQIAALQENSNINHQLHFTVSCPICYNVCVCVVLTIWLAKNWVSHLCFSIYRCTCSLYRTAEMYRQRKTMSTNSWPVVFEPVVQAIQRFVLSIVRPIFFGMLSHPTVDCKTKKMRIQFICLAIVSNQNGKISINAKTNLLCGNQTFVQISQPFEYVNWLFVVRNLFEGIFVEY